MNSTRFIFKKNLDEKQYIVFLQIKKKEFKENTRMEIDAWAVFAFLGIPNCSYKL